MDIIKLIVDFAQRFMGMKAKLTAAKVSRRERIAVYFESIAATLNEVVTQLRADEVPHGKCQELLVHSQQLVETVSDEIGKAEAEELAEQLETAHEVELLLHTLHDADDRDARLAELERAAGTLSGLAAAIRASPA